MKRSHNKKYTKKEYSARLDERNLRLGTNFVLVGEYSGQLKPTLHKCLDCGHKWSPRPNNLLASSQSCPSCKAGPSKKKIQERKKITLESDINRRGSRLKKLITLYEGKATVVKFEIAKVRTSKNGGYDLVLRCNTCENTWSPRFSNAFGLVSGCPHCHGFANGGKKHSVSSLREFIKNIQPDIDVSKIKQYTNIREVVPLVCPKHGDFERSPFAMIGAKFICTECGKKSTSEKLYAKFNLEWYSKRLKEVRPELSVCKETEYLGMHSPLSLVCKTHGVVYRNKAQTYLFNGCPRCVFRVTKPHSKVVDYLTDVLRVERVDVNIRKVIAPLELDIWLPDHNIGIEINGFFWHQEAPLKHLNKTLECQKKGIRLIQLWDVEIFNDWLKVRSVLRGAIGLTKKLGARKTEVVQVSNSVAKEFYDKYHMQGYRNQTRGAINLSLQVEGKIYQMMSLDRPYFNKKYDWEITRLATKFKHQVHGGASRLFNTFMKDHANETVITYADLRLFTGKVYEELGFTKVRRSPPNYWYTNGLELLSRYQAQKHKLDDILDQFDSDLTEYENMINDGWTRVYDCGNLVFTKQL